MAIRDIIFRGKRLDNGEWVYGAYCPKSCDDFFGPAIDKPSIIKLDEPCSGFWFEVDPSTVGQFTGLTDKNGKKIFEGDIISIRFEGDAEPPSTPQVWYENGIVCYSEENFVWYVKFEHDSELPLNEYTDCDIWVIGNKWDNPELLEGEG